MRGTWNRFACASAACLIAATVFTIPAAFAIVPPEQSDELRQKALRHPDLHFRNVFVPIAGLGTNLSGRLAADLSSLGVDPGNAYFDRRTGRWGTLLLTRPLIPGTGSGNDLQWSDFAMAAPPGTEALERAVWQAFEAWLLDHAVALGFDPAELGEPRVSVVNERLIHISVGRVVDGVPVRQTLITAAINSGNLVLTGARNWGQVAASTTPRLAADDAEQVLRDYLEGFVVAGVREPARLELVPVSDQDDESRITIGQGVDYRLVWVLQPVLGGSESWEALVDAHSGEVLSFQDLNDYLSRRVEGGIFPVSNDGQGDDGALQFGYPMPFADISLDGSPVGFSTTGGNLPPGTDAGTISTALSGQFININDNCGAVDESAAAGDLDLDGVPLPGTDCDVPADHSAGDTNASRTGFYELNRLAEQARGYLSDNTWLQNQLTANMNINLACNAFWSPSAGTVNFYRNGSSGAFSCRNTGEIAAVFDHEWGHGLDNNDGTPFVSNPGEGIADMFAQNRLNQSCIGRGFWISNDGPTSPNCDGYGDPCLDCTGVREVDWEKRASGLPHDIAWIDANCGGGPAPCGGGVHCEGVLDSESAWDFVHRDLMGDDGSPWNLDLNTALELGTRLAFHGTSNVGNSFQCTTDGTGGCNADSTYLGYLAADDDDGDLTNGTPHMTAIFAAFNRHQVACNVPVPVDSGCAGAPTEAPTNLATTAFDEGMELAWDPVAGATEYQIFRTAGVHGCDFGKALVGTTTGTSFTEIGLRNGFEVLYSVMAVGANGACTGPMSGCAAVTPVAGPSGTLTGTVTNSVTTDPIQGVTIEAAGPVTLGGVTLSDGTYTISAPVGTYDITASKEGFFPQTVTGVEVTEGGTFVNDLTLEPLPQTIDVSPTSFTFEVFEAQSDSGTLNVGNTGNIDLTWTIGETETDCATQADVGWLSADPASGVTPPFDSLEVTVTVDSIGLPAGVHEASFCVNSDDPETPVVEVPVTLTVVAAAAIQVAPEEIDVDVEAGMTHDETLTVSNLGSINLDWTIVQETLRRGFNAPLSGSRPVTDGAPRSSSLLTPADGAADAALDPELVAAAEAGIELSEPLPPDQRPRARGTSPDDVLQDGALIVPNTTLDFIVALDPETGDVVDPALIDISAFTGARREALLHPDGERILLSAQTGDVVHAFSVEDGSYLGVFAPAGGADDTILDNVRGMDFHPVTGNLLVTSADDPAADRVVEFDLEGNFVRVFIDGAANDLTSPWDLLVRESDILVTNFLSPAGVQRYDFDGNFLGVFAELTGAPAQMAFAANGNILVSSLSDGLYELDPDGNVLANYEGTVTSQAGVYELPNLNFVLSGSFSGPGQGIHELDRTNTLVRNILDGTSYFVNFAKSLDCAFPSWLSVSPTSGTTAPGGSTDVTVTIDTDLLGLGEHKASICFESNDPIEPLLVVPVTLEVFGDVPMADISPTAFDVDLPFGGSTTEVLNIGNVGQLDLMWGIEEADAAAGCESPSDVGWLSANPTSGTTAPSASIPVDVGIDTVGLSAGVYEALLCVSTNDGDNLLVPIPVTLTVLGAVADITPESFAFEVLEGGTDGGTMTIASGGTEDLTWSIADSDAGCATPSDAVWLSADPTSGTTPPGSSADVAVAVDSAGLAPDVYNGTLCITTNVPGGELAEVPVTLTVNASPVIDVVPDSLSVTLETDSTQVEPVDIHNLGSATLDWTIPTDPAFGTGTSEPLIGFDFASATGGNDPPQNWTRISDGDGSVPNAPDDTGAPTDVTFTWGPIEGSMSFLSSSTLATDAVPQYDYDLQGMTGYGFGSGDRFFIELSGLDPNAPYEYWFVAYRSGSGIDNVVDVSDGDVVNAFQFNQFITAGDNDGRFIVNDQVSSDTQQWNDISFATTSSSTGTIRIEWEGDTQSTVIGAFAVRPLLNCALPSWLSIAPTSGSIDPGNPPDTVDVTFDSTGLAEGTYTDAFCVESNDPLQPKVGVPVTMIVSGQVPIADISPSSFEVEVPRDGNAMEILNIGNLGLIDLDWTIAEANDGASCASPVDVPWLSASPTAGTTEPSTSDPVDVAIDALGLAPGVHEAALCVSTNDPDAPLVPIPVTLTVLGATADISPASFAFELPEGGTDEGTLTIGSTGTEDLTWSVAEAETDCATPSDVTWLSAAPTGGTTPPGSSDDVAVTVDTVGLAPDVYTAFLCVATNDAAAEEVAVPVTLTVNAAPVVDVVPESLEVVLETNDSTVETVDIHNLGAATLDWTIPTDPALGTGASDPLIGFDFASPTGGNDPPLNWTRISDAEGTLADVPDDTGAPTDVSISWGAVSGSPFLFLSTDTLADDAVPQYDYDLTGMTGYGFRAGGRLFVELSGLNPNAPYEYWFVAYRGGGAIDNVVEVSDGDMPNAIMFNQFITSGDNDGSFIVNDQVGNNTQHWNDLSFTTTSNSTGTIRIEFEGDTQTTILGAFAIRPALNCALPGWLSIAPTTGSIAPGDPPDTVLVTIDSTGLGLGTHNDAFCVESNDPFQPVVGVPVSLTVTLPGDEAVVEGTVQSLGHCGADPSGLEDATVEIVGAQNTFTLTTDENGFYQAFINEIESPIDINVTAAGHLPASVEDISFTGGDTVVQDFDLTLAAPCGTADPGSFSFEVAEGGTATDTLTIGNVAGGGDLTWSITEGEAPAFVSAPPTGVAPASAVVDVDDVAAVASAATGAGGPVAIDFASELGQELPALVMVNPSGDGVDCEAAPGIVIHDDGILENGYSGSPDAGVTEVRFVDKFTPTAYPTVYSSVCLGFITGSGPTTYDVEVVVFDDDGADGEPGTELGSVSATVTVTEITTPIPPGTMATWNSVDISSLGLDVTEGSVYIGARWVPPADGLANVFAAADQSTDRPVGFAGGYWWNDNANEWIVMQTDPGGFPDYRSLMVRAVEQQIDCDNPVDVPWLSVSPTSGTTAAGGTSDVQVSVDSTGLAPGEYSAGLCLATNDSTAGLIAVPVDLTVVGPVPIADITPSSFSFTVAQGGIDSDTLNMGNIGAADLVWSLEEAESPGLQLDHEFFEDFDSYDVGSQMHGQGGWKGWDNDPDLGALVSDAQSTSAPHSVDIVGDSDLVHEFSDVNSGQWTVTAQQYVPSDFSGESLFILLNTYADGGTDNNWSTQVTFDSATNQVSNDGPAGGTLPLVTGQWVELRVEIDFDTDTQTFFYNGEQLFTGSWTDGLSEEGALNLQAIDLFANGATTVYYDDISVVGPPPPADCAAPSDVTWLSTNPTSGTTPPAETVPVTVSVDATGLSPGDYSALLCATTNDSDAALVEIPVDLTVTDDVAMPEIGVDPTSLSSTLDADQTETQPLTISNTGDAMLEWMIEETDCASPVDVSWVSVAPTGGTTAPAGSQVVDVTFDSTGLAPDTYTASLCIDSNDPVDPEVTVPVTLTVTGTPAVLVPAALVVDTDGTASDDNGVFEPGESVDVAPSWMNLGGESAALTGTATSYTGPAGADYTIDTDAADYGEVAGGATASCLDTGTCYDLSVTDPATRPAPHWDSVLDEQVSDGSVHSWTLHIGDTFDDVPRAGLFYSWVETLLHNEVTSGCVAGQYCPAGVNTRAQMAVFLLRSAEGGDFVPPACEEGSERFPDVPATSQFCPWIEELAARGVTEGCGGGDYCPTSPVSRAQMAVFLLRALEGSSYEPQECTGVFTDVTCPSTFADWIEDLVARGITSGCGNDNYCPADPVTRGQMAVFLSKTFDLVLYGP